MSVYVWLAALLSHRDLVIWASDAGALFIAPPPAPMTRYALHS